MAHQVGDPVPVVELVGDEGGHALLIVGRLADRLQLLEGGRRREARALEQVGARDAHDHRTGFPGEAVGLACGVLQRGLGAADEIGGVPFGRREVRVVHEVVERRQPAGADPAAGIDEGDVEEIPGAALGRELEVGALVVDREGLGREVDRHPGGLLELRDVFLEVRVEDVLEGGAIDGHAVERPGLPDHRGRGKAHGADGRRRGRALEHRAPRDLRSDHHRLRFWSCMGRSGLPERQGPIARHARQAQSARRSLPRRRPLQTVPR